MKLSNIIRHVILHIGGPKTATTSIQETFFANTIPPEYAHKYYHPKSTGSNHGEVFRKMLIDTYHLGVLAHATTLDFHNENKINKMALSKELQNSSYETLVISGESLAAGSEETLIRLKCLLCELCHSEHLTFSIVIYARNLISYYTSALQHLTRKHHYISYDDYDQYGDILLNSDYFFPNNLQKFINVFGKNNIQVFKLEDAVLHQHGPVGFFYDKFLNFKLDDISKLTIKKENEGFSQIAIDLCQFINHAEPMFTNDKTALSGKRTLEDLSPFKNITGNKFKLKKKDRFFYLNKSQAQIDYLKNTFGIHYSIEEMQSEIERDVEPCHVPTKKNIEEINQIFYTLDPLLQTHVLRYLQENPCLKE